MNLDEAIRRLADDDDAPPLARRLAQHAVATEEGQLRVGLPFLGSRELQVGDIPVLGGLLRPAVGGLGGLGLASEGLAAGLRGAAGTLEAGAATAGPGRNLQTLLGTEGPLDEYEMAHARRNATIRAAFADGGPLAAYDAATATPTPPPPPGAKDLGFIPVGTFNPAMDLAARPAALELALGLATPARGTAGAQATRTAHLTAMFDDLQGAPVRAVAKVAGKARQRVEDVALLRQMRDEVRGAVAAAPVGARPLPALPPPAVTRTARSAPPDLPPLLPSSRRVAPRLPDEPGGLPLPPRTLMDLDPAGSPANRPAPPPLPLADLPGAGRAAPPPRLAPAPPDPAPDEDRFGRLVETFRGLGLEGAEALDEARRFGARRGIPTPGDLGTPPAPPPATLPERAPDPPATDLPPPPADPAPPANVITRLTDAVTSLLPEGATRSVLAHGLTEARKAQERADDLPGVLPGLGDWGTIWRKQVTQTPRNLGMDEASGRVFIRGAQGPEASALVNEARRSMAERLDLPEMERYPSITTDALDALGVGEQIRRGRRRPLDLGGTFHAVEGALDKQLSSWQTMVGEAAFSLFNPLTLGTKGAGLALAGVKGNRRAWQSGMFKAINDFQQHSFRHAVFADEVRSGAAAGAAKFLPKLEAQGVDTAALAERGGLFSADDVRALTGDGRLAGQWQRFTDDLVRAGEQRAKQVLGDYTRKTGRERGVGDRLEERLGGAIPFISWPRRAYPVVGQMVAQHPGVALGIVRLTQLDAEEARREGRAGYQVGTIPISTETPVVGPIVRAYLGGREGNARLNLAGVASPVPGQVLMPEERPGPDERTGYQRASDTLERFGFGFNPAIEAAAYVTGQDYRGPGALSRTAGVENALPGPTVPAIGEAALNVGRRVVMPAVEGAGVPTSGAVQPEYDPIMRRYAEIVQDRTGKPLSDRSNLSYVVESFDKDSPLYRQAERDVRRGGGIRAAASLALPVPIQADPDVTRENRRARELLHPYADIKRARDAGDEKRAKALERANRELKSIFPEAATYDDLGAERRAALLVEEFERREGDVKKRFPGAYASRKARFIQELQGQGIPVPDWFRGKRGAD